MTTAREHMANDMAWLFAREGEEVRDVVIDGNIIRAMTGDIKTEQIEDGSWLEIIEVTVLQSALAVVPQQGIVVDGVKYTVEMVKKSGVLLTLGLVRSVA